MLDPIFHNVVGIVGYKNNGKTTLVERLVAWLVTARGLRVSTVKHAHHTVDLDQPGRDSYRHREAGAEEVILATAKRVAVLHELRDAPEPSLAELLRRLSPVDIVLVEGYKTGPHDKIEVKRQATETPLLALSDPSVRAVASDAPLPGLSVPVLPLDDVAGIGGFALELRKPQVSA